jgi:hypothetical protein
MRAFTQDWLYAVELDGSKSKTEVVLRIPYYGYCIATLHMRPSIHNARSDIC